MRKLIAFATLQLACWLGRIGFRVAGKDMRESLVALQIVPTPERAEREMAEWLRKVREGGVLDQSLGGALHETPRWKGWN